MFRFKLTVSSIAFLLTSFGAHASENLCEGYVTHNKGVTIPQVRKPPYMKYYREPAFGTKVIRITNSLPDEVRKPPYSTVQAWNADESLLLMWTRARSYTTHQLLDGHTYKVVRDLDFTPSDLEDVFWSHSDPDVLYYISKIKPDAGEFKRYNVSTNKSTTIKDFSPWCGTSMPTPGGGVQMQSLDDDLFGFRCLPSNGNRIMLTYRLSTDTVTVAPIGKGTRWNEWHAPIATPSGKSLWYQGTSLAHDLKTINHTLDMYKYHEHQNLGRTHDGQDAMFTLGFNESPKGCDGDPEDGVGHLIEHNMETGKCRNVISRADGYPYTTSSTHISAQAYKKPGWIAMSSVGKGLEWLKNGEKAPALSSEIYLVNTDPDNKVVCRLAHHRSYAKLASNGDYSAYFGEPHVTISPSGTRLFFGSDWYDSGSVDSYIIELPGYKRPE